MGAIQGGMSGSTTPNSLLKATTDGLAPSVLTDDGTTVGLPTGKVLAIEDAAGLTVGGVPITATSVFNFKGAIDCAADPNYPAAAAGDVYKVSVAGKIGGGSGPVVQIGDILVCVTTGIAGTEAQAGARWVIEQGNVVSTADVPASADKNYVTDAGLVVVANAVIGAAAGFKIARSAAPVALDGTNPTSVAHGLTSCIAAFVQLAGSGAPGAGTSVLSAVINGANIDVYGWKPTTGGAAGNPDLVAADGTETFHWFAIGT